MVLKDQNDEELFTCLVGIIYEIYIYLSDFM